MNERLPEPAQPGSSPASGRWLRYRAGARALQRLRDQGLGPGTIRAIFGPASGPRWLALVGLDRALLESDLLTGSAGPSSVERPRTVLAGASAGAWRMATFACRDPLDAHRQLLEGYVGQVFQRGERPEAVSRAYRQMLGAILEPELDHLLAHPSFDLAIHTARQRILRSRFSLVGSLLAAAAVGPLSRRATDLSFERVLFHSAPERLSSEFDGEVVPLQWDNLLEATLASGTVPYYLEAVRDPAGAPLGAYVDGGLTDYHLSLDSAGPGDGIVLLPHYTERIVPRWLDRGRPHRDLTGEAAADVLQIFPSHDFLARLPDGQLPDRNDFLRFADDPDERQRRWRIVVAESERLGEELLSDLESGRIAELTAPL